MKKSSFLKNFMVAATSFAAVGCGADYEYLDESGTQNVLYVDGVNDNLIISEKGNFYLFKEMDYYSIGSVAKLEKISANEAEGIVPDVVERLDNLSHFDDMLRAANAKSLSGEFSAGLFTGGRIESLSGVHTLSLSWGRALGKEKDDMYYTVPAETKPLGPLAISPAAKAELRKINKAFGH